MNKLKDKIKVAIVSGDSVEENYNTKQVYYLIENQFNDVLDLVEMALRDGFDEKISIKVKYISREQFNKIKPVE